jgi:hypothetical protein
MEQSVFLVVSGFSPDSAALLVFVDANPSKLNLT